MRVIEVTDSNFEQMVSDHDGLVFVDFWAEWCGPCKSLAPQYEALSASNPDVLFLKANTAVTEQSAIKYKIRSIPTIIVFVDGTEVCRHLGSRGLEDFVNEVIGLNARS